MRIEVIWEDEDILAINKPYGLVVHSDGKSNRETLVDWISSNYPQTKGVGDDIILSNGEIIERPGIVHRLDMETSGVMLIAKTNDSYACLKKQFQDREIEKNYRAFVYGEIKENTGVIDRPIARSKNDFRKWSAQRGSRGVSREAVTNFLVIKRFGEGTFLNISPKTGRTHQIRVHFKAINHPVVCDKLYAPNNNPILGFTRLALHSFGISFNNMKGERTSIQAPYPKDFEEAIKEIQ